MVHVTARFFTAKLFLLACLFGYMPTLAVELVDVPRPAPGSVEESVAEQIEESRQALDQLLASDATAGDKAASFGELGQIYAVYELWDAANACLSNAVALDPDAYAWHYLLGWTEQQRADLEAARVHLDRAAALAPGDAAAWIRLGEVLLGLDRGPTAAEAFAKAAELEPSAAAWFGRGRAAALAGETRRAVTHFEKALELESDATSIHYPLAHALRKLGEDDAARRHLALRGNGKPSFRDPLIQVVDAKARGGAFHKFHGDQLVLRGDLRGAAGAYQKAVSANPSNYYYRKSYGLTLHAAGRPGARTELEAALRFTGGVPDREIAEMHYTLGSLAANERREDDARGHFESAVELDPSLAVAQLQLGNLAGRGGDREAALDHFGKALVLAPDLSDALLNRATTLMDLGRFEEAIPDLEKLLARGENQRVRWLLDTARERAES